MNSVITNSLSLKYLRFTPPGCTDIGIRQFNFVTNTQFLCYKQLLKKNLSGFFLLKIGKELSLCHNLKFKLRFFDLTEFLDLRHWVAKINGLENQSLWQKLIFFDL